MKEVTYDLVDITVLLLVLARITTREAYDPVHLDTEYIGHRQ